MNRILRITSGVELLSKRFKAVSVSPMLRSVLIQDFELPKGWNRRVSRLLIELPMAYPRIPPMKFFIDKGLLRHGQQPAHYYETLLGNFGLRRGYAWICMQSIASWRPSVNILEGDNLITICNIVYQFLSEP